MAGNINSKTKDVWDIIRSLGPVFVAITVAFIGGWYNLQQSELQREFQEQSVYTEIMAQRENSDNSIRANMFNMLFEAMFEESLRRASERNPATEEFDYALQKRAQTSYGLSNIAERIMFLDLLSRNFETIDIKPLFEDLDEGLTKKIRVKSIAEDERKQLYKLRKQLRSIGSNLSVRQLNALASIPDSIVQRLYVLEKDGKIEVISKGDEVANGEETIPVRVRVRQIDEGKVKIAIEFKGSEKTWLEPQAPTFNVTFYDLPYIDNVRLPSDVRVAVTLRKCANLEELDTFKELIDEKLVKDYESYKHEGVSKFAELYLIKFPAEYTGLRDRPYLERILQDLVEGKRG